MRTKTKTQILEEIKWKLDSCKETNDKFIAMFKEDPVHAFKWSHDYIKNVAIERVYKIFEDHIVKGRTMVQIRHSFVDEYTRGAKWPENSTSPTSNLMSQCLTSAYVDICETISEWEIE